MDLIFEITHSLKTTFLVNPSWQIIWIIAFFLSIYNFLYCRDRKFIIVTAIASLFWWVHFFLIWAITAAFINFFDISKNIASLKWERKKSWMLVFIWIYVVIWFFTYENYYSLLPTFSAIFSTYLVFMTRWIKMKAWFLIVVLAWFIYNIYFWSIWGILTDVSLAIAWIIWIIKDLKNDKKA